MYGGDDVSEKYGEVHDGEHHRRHLVAAEASIEDWQDNGNRNLNASGHETEEDADDDKKERFRKGDLGNCC